MIESTNDFISLVALVAVLVMVLVVMFRTILVRRERKKIEKEIEYYKEWY
ncbi:MAG: hypothetical protein LBR25_00245 [Erysipelotrichaceae bacterium]|jgi:preprotein translocase subunit YajC|nr:hypothetical protein [Erysipelotrichaceae bacterium]